MSKPPTVTEQLMAKRLSKKPFSQQTPGDVLYEAFEQMAPGVVQDPYLTAEKLDPVARAFLNKVMASG